MKRLFGIRSLYLAGLVLVIGVNVVVVTGAMGNRRGEPDSLVRLTERELSVPGYHRQDNSGLALALEWRILPEDATEDDFGGHWGAAAWFDASKLEELGFDTAALQARAREGKTKRPLSKEVYIVLEYDGAAHREALLRAAAALAGAAADCPADCTDKKRRTALEQAESRLAREREELSRLFAVDAGTDAARLRDRYPDRSRFLITPGIVDVWRQERQTLRGHVRRLSVSAVHVPLELKMILEELPAKGYAGQRPPHRPRYEVDLAFGRRLEPWIRDIRRLEPKS
jgi:hypothetical protein